MSESRLKTFVNTPRPVKAVQFFRANPPLEVVQVAYSDPREETYLLDAKHKKPDKNYEEVYVIHGGSPFLKDTDWLVVGNNGDGYVSIMEDWEFQRLYVEQK